MLFDLTLGTHLKVHSQTLIRLYFSFPISLQNFNFLLCITGCELLLLYSSHHAVFSADADVRLARRIRRDTVEKGRDIAMVLDQVGLHSCICQFTP